jgi:hypothetical protein
MAGTGSIMTSAARTEALSLLDRLCARHSSRPGTLVAPCPSEDDIRMVARTASRAPDHQHLKPFRVISIGPDSRGSLADVFEAAEREVDPGIGGEKLERTREKALHAPVLLAVISRVQAADEVPEIEQRASAGAAQGYAVLAADLLGYGAMGVRGDTRGRRRPPGTDRRAGPRGAGSRRGCGPCRHPAKSRR